MHVAEEMISCNWLLPQGDEGWFLLDWNDIKLDHDQLEQTFFLQYAHTSLLRTLLQEQASVKVLRVPCPSPWWISILLCNRFLLRISCLAASVFNEEWYAVLALPAMNLTLPAVAHIVLWSAVVGRTAVVSHQCFVYWWAVLAQHQDSPKQLRLAVRKRWGGDFTRVSLFCTIWCHSQQ